MKKVILYAVLFTAGALLFSCSKKHTTGSNGYFGNLLSIKENYSYDDSVLSVKAQTEVKSMDEAIAIQSKKNKLENNAKSDFEKEAAKTKLPVTVPFIDSSNGKDYSVKDVKITKITWNTATIEAAIQLKQNSNIIMGSMYSNLIIPARLLNYKDSLITAKGYDFWATFTGNSSKQIKNGETVTVSYDLPMNATFAADFKKIIFKSYNDYKKSQGF